MKKSVRFLAASLFGFLLLASGPRSASIVLAIPLDISINTSDLSGTNAQLAFDFYDANTAVNSVTISNLLITGGSLGDAACDPPNLFDSTDTCSDLPPPYPVTLVETNTFDNHLAQRVTLGSSLSFTVDLTTNFTGTVGVDFPDSFAFLILLDSDPPDPFADYLVYTTGLAANALVQVDIDGSPTGKYETASTFTDKDNNPYDNMAASVTPVPEPGTLLLLLSGLPAVFWRVARRQRGLE